MANFDNLINDLTDKAHEFPYSTYIGFMTRECCNEMFNWCHENCEFGYLINDYVARFERESDHIAWKLRWAYV